MKKNVIFFGNCQAGHLTKIMSKLINSDEFHFQHYANNARTGGQKSIGETLDAIGNADFLFYQPLGDAHGGLSEENILQTINCNCVPLSFSYIFNSGICSLCYAPQAGKILGSDIIIAMLKDKQREDIVEAFRHGDIDFDLPHRFNTCLTEMRRREEHTNIKISDYIEANYKSTRLFVSHNHPSNPLFFEVIRQIFQLTDLPMQKSLANLRVNELPNTNCSISPFDKAALGYQFNADEDWFEQGTFLINKIIDDHEMKIKTP